MSVKTNNPLMQYHPIRFSEVRRDFITKTMNIFLSGLKGNTNHVFSLPSDIVSKAKANLTDLYITDILSSVSNELFPTNARQLFNIGNANYRTENKFAANVATDFFENVIESDYNTFLHYAAFIHSGSNIFEFSPNLLNFFAQTDVDNVLLRDIRLPFDTIYLHFGKQLDKTINGNISFLIEAMKQDRTFQIGDTDFLLDGAYITQCFESNTLRITLTSVKDKRTKYRNNCIDSYEDRLAFVLEADSASTNIRDAGLKEREILLENNREHLRQVIAKNELAASTRSYGSVGKSVDKVIDYLKLVINCVLYLQSYPDDIEEDYTESAPRNLVEQSKRAPGAAAAAKKKLDQLGYRKIKFCGRKRQQFWQLEDEDTEELALVGAVSGESKGSMAPHKRRAHIRKQRYGKELQSWRYVWIKETTIHKEKYEQAPTLYRIYEVAD